MCVFEGENKDTEVEEEKEVSTELEGFCPLHPGGLHVSLKTGPRGFQSRLCQSDLYLHACCKEMLCKCVSSSVSN